MLLRVRRGTFIHCLLEYKSDIATLEDSLAVSYKAKYTVPHYPAIVILCIYPNELEKLHTKTFT